VPSGSDLFTVAPGGTGMDRVLATPKLEADVAWSPDGTRLLFRRTDIDFVRSDLWTVSPDGAGSRRVTDDAAVEFPAGWAPA
jgi:hypothetical protein